MKYIVVYNSYKINMKTPNQGAMVLFDALRPLSFKTSSGPHSYKLSLINSRHSLKHFRIRYHSTYQSKIFAESDI